MNVIPIRTQQSVIDRYYENFDRVLSSISGHSQVLRLRRETREAIAKARQSGNEEAARCLETAECALADAREAMER